MKYYFLTTGTEQGADLPTEMFEDLNVLELEYNNEDADDWFYIGIYQFDTSTLEITELKSKGYKDYF